MDSVYGVNGLSDSLDMNSSYPSLIQYTNTSNGSINTEVTFFAKVIPDVSGVPSSTFVLDSVDYSSFSFPVNITDTIGFTLDVSPNYYMLGGNTTVIWPVASGLTGDTLYVYNTVFLNNSMDEDPLDDTKFSFKVYPNPAKSVLSIELESYDEEVEQVRIFCLDGRIVYSGPYERSMSVAHLPSGCYSVELLFEGGQRENKIFFIEN